jgi:hypothetical protein
MPDSAKLSTMDRVEPTATCLTVVRSIEVDR